MAHHLADLGEVNLLATVTSVACDKSIAAMSVINTFYGRRDLPLGAYKGDFGMDCSSQDLYLDALINNYDNNGVWDSGDVDDVQDVYVRVLGE